MKLKPWHENRTTARRSEDYDNHKGFREKGCSQDRRQGKKNETREDHTRAKEY